MLLKSAPLGKTITALRSGELNLNTYLEDLLTHLEAVEPEVQALLPEANRRGRLLEAGAALEARFPKPEDRPPLYGIPIGVKDIFRVDGFPTQAGSKVPAEALTGAETACVTRLKEAGALILGKTVTTEFAYFAPGPTRNPHNLKHTPGGSSSGSAVAVAAGFCPLTLGTQTIGSVIRPAAYCGIVGFKPSYGRIDPTGLLFVSKSLDHVGLFTQDVAGMIAVAPILCEGWRPELTQIDPNQKPILGVPEGAYLQQASEEGLTKFKMHLIRLEEAGYIIRQVPTLEDIDTIAHHHVQLMAAEMAQAHQSLFAQYQTHYRTRTADLIQQGQKVSQAEINTARAKQDILRNKMHDLMADVGIDVWVTPAAPGPAPEGIEATGNPAMNLPWTNTGLPSVTVPAGKAANGLPLGLQCVAPFMDDERLLEWSLGFEKALGKRK